MGMVFAEITLTNVYDCGKAQEGLIKPEDVRSATVTAIVDTGSINLVITEELCQKLGLMIKGEKIAHIANGERISCKVTDAVEIRWKDRDTVVPALVIPGAEKILLGAIPLEGMDLMVNPVTQELAGVHGNKVEFLVL
jgi:clan AA aspartic protease